MLDFYLETVKEELVNYINSIDITNLNAAKAMIVKAESNNNRVHITGIGKPSYVAGYTASLFSSTGTSSYFLDGTEAIHGSAGQVREGDVVIALSNSGETKELLATLQTLKNNGAQIIACTSSDQSTMSKMADIVLVAGVKQEGDDLNKPPRASILSEMVCLQALSVLLQEEKNINPEIYLKWHPGGALGDSIRNDKGE